MDKLTGIVEEFHQVRPPVGMRVCVRIGDYPRVLTCVPPCCVLSRAPAFATPCAS